MRSKPGVKAEYARFASPCAAMPLIGADRCHDKASALRSLMEELCLQPEELAYVGDAISDIAACREAGTLCLSAA